MATAPQASLPVFYQDLMPLNSRDHATWKSRTTDKAPWLTGFHAVPLTVEEFPQAARHFPIIFSTGDSPVPLALLGLNEGVNVFVDAEGKLTENIYVPAYVRRYPFLLAKLAPDSDELSLCFDPTPNLVGAFDEGNALFDGDQPSEATKAVLGFCEQFEQAGMKTQALGIQQEGVEQPFIYRGFQMIDQEKLREVRGDVLRGWNQSGLLPLIYAHLFSLDLIREIFGRQVQQGKGPVLAPAA